MSREWKPGDVAEYRYLEGPQIALRVSGCLTGGHSAAPHWHLSGGGWSTASHATLRPLVVIDPEDREAVERLTVTWMERGGFGNGCKHIDNMQAALREFANPRDPKPQEPLGLGAVVEDADGKRYLRIGDTGTDDWRESGFRGGATGSWYRYDEFDAVKVLSEGVQ